MVVNSDAGSPDGTGRVVIETEPPDYVEEILLTRPNHKLERVSLTYPEIDGVGGRGRRPADDLRDPRPRSRSRRWSSSTPTYARSSRWIELLSEPILKGGYDYVSPLYALQVRRHDHQHRHLSHDAPCTSASASRSVATSA